MSDLIVRNGTVVLPSGEQFELATIEESELARFLDEVREYESLLREAKGEATQEMLRRMDDAVRSGEQEAWTQTWGDYKVSAPSKDTTTQIDGEALYVALSTLAGESDVIGQAAVDRAIKREVSYKVDRAKIGRLAKLSPLVADVVERNTEEVPARRYVKVGPA